MRNLSYFIGVYLLAAASQADAQNLQCPDIAKTLKEYSIDSSSSSYLGAVFTQHCQSDGSRKSSGGGVGLDAVVKAIPLKFTGSYTTSDEGFSNFCKSYASHVSTSNASDSYKETISRKALETIQQCLTLQASGVIVTHEVSNVESANFYLRNSVTQKLMLEGISIAGDVSCTGQVNGSRKQFDSNISVDVKSTVSFACKRAGQANAVSSAKSFGEAIVTVLTNQGNYSLFWPRDERQSESMATAIDKRITAAEGDIAITKANVAPLVLATSMPIYKCPTGALAHYDAPWMYVGCNGQISSEKQCINYWYRDRQESRECVPIGNMRLFK
ncbi:hypothetical protein EIP75_02140 [Aquabacterium soli]|uniref:Uncharacterized protein n=1 Tax=Aquabacterium soli TaxID=2493092 RepID=A0A426VHN7_9BURK|nr:hypothetical protein [Aquabacterium soli]RRS06404.1 hypothetical protein EIP75_02140 [Aquabacterium soli]